MYEGDRFPQWTLLAGFSIIALASLVHILDDDNGEWTTGQRWVLGAKIISLVFSAVGTLAHLLMPSRFSGSHVEGALVVILVGVWSAAMPFVLNPDNDLASDTDFRLIKNSNVFFFSWACLFASISLLAKYYREHYRRVEDAMEVHWGSLAIASWVIVGSAARMWNDFECQDDGTEFHGSKFCDRTTFALVLGVISGAISFIVLLMTWKLFLLMVSVLMLVAWCIAAAYLTFETDFLTVATRPSTLYFAIWSCVIITLHMSALLVRELWVFEVCVPENTIDTSGMEGEVIAAKNKAVQENVDMEEEERAEQEAPSPTEEVA